MSNEYQSTTKPFPDNHVTPAFTPATPEIDMSKVEAELTHIHISHVEEEVDALALFEASVDKPKTVVTPPPVTAPTLPQSPVLPNFPEPSSRLEPVVSQSRPMPELATIAPVPALTTAIPTPPVETPKPSAVPVSMTTPTPVHGLSLAEGQLPPSASVSATQANATSVMTAPAPVNNTPESAMPAPVPHTVEDGVVGSVRVVNQPSHSSAVTITTISEGVVGSARVVGSKTTKTESTKDAVNLEEPAVNLLQKVINAYTQLEHSIAANKVELEEASIKLQAVKEKKQVLESKLHEITPPGLPAPLQAINAAKDSVMELDALHSEVKESKINTQNRSCDTVIEYAKSIRKHIVGDSAKAEEFLKPLNLSCEILKTNIQHVRTLEQVVELMEIKKSLTHKRNEVHKTIHLLMGQIA